MLHLAAISFYRFRGKKLTLPMITGRAVIEPGIQPMRPGKWWIALICLGVGKDELKPSDLVKLGGIAVGKLPAAATDATILADLPARPMTPVQAASIAFGATLRAYRFVGRLVPRARYIRSRISRSTSG